MTRGKKEEKLQKDTGWKVKQVGKEARKEGREPVSRSQSCLWWGVVALTCVGVGALVLEPVGTSSGLWWAHP